MTTRPFRDLCPDADERDAMTDDEFWVHVLHQPDWPMEDYGYDTDVDVVDDRACVTCGSTGACSYDSEGRPLIHTTQEDE